MEQANVFKDEQRRRDLRRSGLNGIDDVEVGAGLLALKVRLFKPLVTDIEPKNVRIDGGARVCDVAAIEVHCDRDGVDGPQTLIVALNRPGDFSTYTLSLVEPDDAGQPRRPMAGFDPICSSAEFRFREAAADLDCAASPAANAPERHEPDINYLAKDYASFRKLVMDRLSLLMPAWREAHVPDLGVAIVEILAYTGDYLSYQQDAVATEAYLETARQRISVRRHARLVDYRIHEGCNARAWIQIFTDADLTVANSHDMSFGTGAGGDLSFEPVSGAPVRVYAAHNEISFHAWGSPEFELPAGATSAVLRDQWEGEIEDIASDTGPVRDAYEAPPVPPPKPTRQRLLRHLGAGDFLLLKEVRSAATGLAADAGPARRHVVRLTQVVADIDPVYNQPIVRIEWGQADALPFALTISATGPAPRCVALGPATKLRSDLTVASANIVLADHGRHVVGEVLDGCVPLANTVQRCVGAGRASDAIVSGGRYRAVLKQGPVTFRSAVAKPAPASQRSAQDPRACLPQIQLKAIPGLVDGSGPLFDPGDLDDASALAVALSRVLHGQPIGSADDQVVVKEAKLRRAHELIGRLEPATLGLLRYLDPSGAPTGAVLHALYADLHRLLQQWRAQPDLLESRADDLHYAAEIDNDGMAHLRFGDGDCGKRPDAGTQFVASYRVGSGPSGNVGADTLTHVSLRADAGAGLTVTNPLPAIGGTLPESLRDIKLRAPTAMRATLERAITADDYARLAEANPKVQRAAATLRWNGSRYLVRVAVDPLGTETVSAGLLDEIGDDLHRYQRIGHDVEVVPATYVPLDVAMTIHALPRFHAKEVKGEVLSVFSARVLADWTRGVFHPDNLSFGVSVDLSRLVNRAQRVVGVESVSVMRLERLNLGPNAEIENGVLPIGALEIARLDNDPNFPERGRFTLKTRGGR